MNTDIFKLMIEFHYDIIDLPVNFPSSFPYLWILEPQLHYAVADTSKQPDNIFKGHIYHSTTLHHFYCSTWYSLNTRTSQQVFIMLDKALTSYHQANK